MTQTAASAARPALTLFHAWYEGRDLEAYAVTKAEAIRLLNTAYDQDRDEFDRAWRRSHGRRPHAFPAYDTAYVHVRQLKTGVAYREGTPFVTA